MGVMARGRRGGRRGDGVAGLFIGFAGAVVLHALFLPGFGLLLQSDPAAGDTKKRRQSAQLVRLSSEAWQLYKRVQLELKDLPPADPERKKRDE